MNKEQGLSDKYSDRSMEVKIPALLIRNYDRRNDRPTDRPTNRRGHREVSPTNDVYALIHTHTQKKNKYKRQANV